MTEKKSIIKSQIINLDLKEILKLVVTSLAHLYKYFLKGGRITKNFGSVAAMRTYPNLT